MHYLLYYIILFIKSQYVFMQIYSLTINLHKIIETENIDVKKLIRLITICKDLFKTG